MATAKKSTTTKKSVAKTSKKASAPKKAVVKRAPAKTESKTKVSTKQVEGHKSFRRSKPDRPFLSFTPSMQTFYWLILAGLVLTLAMWVASISTQVQRLYDDVDELNAQADSLVVPRASDKNAQ
ncbi:MAG: hypothetical protein WBP12_00010 [Candidatus Saccharimonas sp.]